MVASDSVGQFGIFWLFAVLVGLTRRSVPWITPNSKFHMLFRVVDPLDLASHLVFIHIFFGFVSFIMQFYGPTVGRVFMIKVI